MALAVPLSSEQIAAAGRLREHLPGWIDSEQALDILARQLHELDQPSVLLKVVTVNTLYGTNVYAVTQMAEHVRDVLSRRDLATANHELVEELAHLPATAANPKPKRFRSFASKFAHFFIDAQRFPILDQYSERMVKLHLGPRNTHHDDNHRYIAFARNIETLKRLANFSGSTRALDRYLWLAGQYRAWKKKPNTPMNAETKRLFTSPPPDLNPDLALLLSGD